MKRATVRNRPFTIALTVSAVFHLSMVSVFSIVIWFPRHDVEYYAVDIVRETPMRRPADPLTTASPSRGKLRLSSPGELLDGSAGSGFATESMDDIGEELSLTAPDDVWAALPDIELAHLEFAALERISTREQSLRIRSQYTDLFERKEQDSWAKFSGQLRGLGDALTRWSSSETAPAAPVSPVRASSQTPGFGVYIEWMSEPKDRALLFSPPIQALWGADPGRFDQPVALVFAVNPQGKVTEVLQVPLEDEDGVVASVGAALLKYVFEPLQGGEPALQRGTLLVRAERDGS